MIFLNMLARFSLLATLITNIAYATEDKPDFVKSLQFKNQYFRTENLIPQAVKDVKINVKVPEAELIYNRYKVGDTEGLIFGVVNMIAISQVSSETARFLTKDPVFSAQENYLNPTNASKTKGKYMSQKVVVHPIVTGTSRVGFRVRYTF